MGKLRFSISFFLLFILFGVFSTALAAFSPSITSKYNDSTRKFYLEVSLNSSSCSFSEIEKGAITEYIDTSHLTRYTANNSQSTKKVTLT